MSAAALLLAQVAVVLVATRAGGRLAGLARQPRVVGEMAAGLALGPSLFGAMAPDLAATLFPTDGLAPLRWVSEVGITLFMFVVGLRLDHRLLRGHRGAAATTSVTSIVVPFALGAWVLAPRLDPSLAGAAVAPWTFALFVGAAMSVTAFPVLARILTERGLLGTHVGTIALASAAFDDVIAWSALAGILAIVSAGSGVGPAATAVGGVAAYGLLVGFVVRPLLRRALAGTDRAPLLRASGAIAFAVLSAGATTWLGVHGLFGAFLAGAVMPRERGFAADIVAKLDGPVTTLLVPLFFAFTGLRTSIGLVTEGGFWGTCAVVLAVAVAAKGGASAVAARITGTPWREALVVGALMNTRGLMELVILNVGLDAGVISPALFAIMVVMALVTTVMTSPLLGLIGATAPRVAYP